MLVAAIMLLTFLGISSTFADSIETTHIAMRKGETLTVSCTGLAIESVYVHGNLSQIELDFPKTYPTSEISFKAMNLGNLDLTITFQHSGDYRISVSILDTLGSLRDVDNYYLSNCPSQHLQQKPPNFSVSLLKIFQTGWHGLEKLFHFGQNSFTCS